ncbi:MAG: hypothetical protein GF393_08555 [Armatimonadia bacterium]|nr:hypothetical protein [Armatimonadia bacterium]
MNALRALWRDDAGSIQAETAILIAVVALASIGAWQHFGETTTVPTDEASTFFEGDNGGSMPEMASPAMSEFGDAN